jgi:hypothetical protein
MPPRLSHVIFQTCPKRSVAKDGSTNEMQGVAPEVRNTWLTTKLAFSHLVG